MKTKCEMNMSDEAFDQFLAAQGADWRSTVQLNPQLEQKCRAAMDAGRAQGRRLRAWGKRTLVSTMGLAAVLAVVVTIAFPPTGSTPVEAKVVLAKLAQQVQGDGVLAVTFDAVRIDEVSVAGQVQIANDSIAGDLNVSVQDGEDESPIVVDASLAITPEKGWVLLRRLEVPDPQAQAMIQLFLNVNSPTLLLLPDGILEELEVHAQGRHLAEIRKLAMGEVAAVVREVLRSGADLGAVTTRQPDGATSVTLRIHNAEVLQKLMEIAATATGKPVDEDLDISEDDAKDILGCMLTVIYDPQTQSVRSFAVSDLAEMKGTITIAIHEGAIDPALLDSARVITPNTRTIDTGFLKGLIESATGGKE